VRRLSSMPGITLLYVFGGLVMAGLGVPLILRVVPPNHTYGFRVPRTIDHPSVWYRANAFAGYGLLASGIVVVATALALRRWYPALSTTRYTLICTLVLVASLSLTVLLSFLYLRSLPDT
jgi:uncharacterized membrane protein